MIKKTLKRTFLFFLFLAFLIWQGAGLLGAKQALRTNFQAIPKTKDFNGIQANTVTFSSSDNIKISAWFAAANQKKQKAVILLSGIYSNRTSLDKHARYYLRNDFSVLMLDLRGTGQSHGEHVTFGWHERKDLLAAYDWLNAKGYTTIGVHGMSLGAATIVYSFQERTDYDFVILESCYDNIVNAFKNRTQNANLRSPLFFPLVFWAEMLGDLSVEDIYPEKFIHLYEGKIMIIAGDNEVKVRQEETLKLFKNANGEKSLNWVRGARHVNLLANYPADVIGFYEDFFRKIE